ncbi:hypothetical protein [Actinosynnema sp. NPDC020468]|uniref:hypothetical protein n=1 Tax=Actinosynnema sp. NPDC020468 TaxID=3154488 RepID=UPI0033CAB0FA
MVIGTASVPVSLSQDWTAEYRGVVIGVPGSPLSFTEIAGLLDAPAVRTNDRATLNRHGEISGTDWLGARTVTLVIEVNAESADEFASNMAALNEAFAPVRSVSPFSFRFPGVAGGGSRVVWGKVRKRVTVMDWAYTHHYATMSVELYCPEPFVLSTTSGTGRATLPASIAPPGSGIRFPLVFPVRFGQSQSAEVVRVDNPGDFAAPLRLTLRGPIGDPAVVNLGTGEQLEFAYTLLAGQWLTVDTATRDVLFNGTPRFLTPGRRNTWLTAPPGFSTFGLRGVRLTDTGPEPELIAEWSATWV